MDCKSTLVHVLGNMYCILIHRWEVYATVLILSDKQTFYLHWVQTPDHHAGHGHKTAIIAFFTEFTILFHTKKCSLLNHWERRNRAHKRFWWAYSDVNKTPLSAIRCGLTPVVTWEQTLESEYIPERIQMEIMHSQIKHLMMIILSQFGIHIWVSFKRTNQQLTMAR